MSNWKHDLLSLLGVLLVAALITCAIISPPKPQLNPSQRDYTPIKSVSIFKDLGNMVTIRHDGHLFVVMRELNYLEHHPSCPCLGIKHP